MSIDRRSNMGRLSLVDNTDILIETANFEGNSVGAVTKKLTGYSY